MTGPSLWRALTTTGRIVLMIGLLLAMVLVGQGLGLRWDPLNLGARRLEAARNRTAVAEADAAARRLEREGDAGQSRAMDQLHRQTLAVTRLTAPAILEARLDDDADLPLAPSRARRLRAHDRELCRLAPAVCAGPATADPAGAGDDALRADAAG
ncbi:hypothetical protein [uncultured Brevundimonas sp.]|uniref:hypothetical protein n=1 Tax=uncultured Brevundimonas sp. TaxID=213418 RepID=UPI0030EC1B0A